LQNNKPDYTLDDILKSVSITRSVPKEKLPIEATILFPSLSSKQQDIISDLEGTLERFKKYDALSILTQKEHEHYEILKSQYVRDIKKAVQAGLIYHPLVFDIVYTHKILGNKEIIRKIKRGWEKGVKRPLTITDLRFINNLEKIAEYRIKGKSWPQIRRILMQRKIIVKMTWQALRKKFKKAWEEEFRKFNKKPPPIP
jgi:hypothetical protein